MRFALELEASNSRSISLQLLRTSFPLFGPTLAEQMYNIGYDISILEDGRFTGVEKVAYYLFGELWKQQSDVHHVAFCRKRPRRLEDLPQNVEIKEVPGGRLWRYWQLPKAIKEADVDCFVSPVMALPRPCGVPMIAYVHECQWRHQSGETGEWRHRRALKVAGRNATLLLTNSEFTKQDIVAEIGKEKLPIEVIHPAGDHTLLSAAPDTSVFSRINLNISKPTALFVSTIRPKKNVDLLIKAFSLPEMESTNLVLAGRIQYPQLTKSAEGHASIYFTDYVTDAELEALYQQASCFVYASQNEGFGLPILEAYEHNVPVIASQNGSIPEVAGDGALLLNTLSSQELAEAVKEVISDNQLRTRLTENGSKQLQKFSWEKSATSMWQAIEHHVLAGS